MKSGDNAGSLIESATADPDADLSKEPNPRTDPELSDSVDLRSDTVTRPCAGMRRAMAEAKVGDDVFGDDPTVKELERRSAELLGKDAAVFFPTGTQSNLAAILSHCGRGDEMIVGRSYHTYAYEAGGASALGGVVFCPLQVDTDGALDPYEIASAVKADDPHNPRTRLLCLENTVSGKPLPHAAMESSARAAREHGLAIHLDGARIFNAAAALGTSASRIASVADSVSACLSKGLGTPAGTMLAGSEPFARMARRNRKILGGGMRQSGVLAAAGLYALEHNVGRLPEDHRRADLLADALRKLPASAELDVRHATNMLFVTPRKEDHASLISFLARRSVLVGNKFPTIRIVMHLGIGDDDVEAAAAAFKEFYLGNADRAAS